MRLIPLPRRHRVLWLIAAVLAVSAWGSWLAATGRTPDYGSGDWGFGASQTVSPPHASVASDVAELSITTVTTPAREADSKSAMASAPSMSSDWPDGAASHAAVSSPAGLAGMTDPVAFARSIAQLLLAYGPRTDFAARGDAVMAVAALPPLGSPVELMSDLAALIPKATAAPADRTVTFTPDTVVPSTWATARLDQLGLPQGAFAIDVTGTQTITEQGEPPLPVSVTVGITGACPTALTQCEIDRIFPRTVQQALHE
jgi:hypothetical protein